MLKIRISHLEKCVLYCLSATVVLLVISHQVLRPGVLPLQGSQRWSMGPT